MPPDAHLVPANLGSRLQKVYGRQRFAGTVFQRLTLIVAGRLADPGFIPCQGGDPVEDKMARQGRRYSSVCAVGSIRSRHENNCGTCGLRPWKRQNAGQPILAILEFDLFRHSICLR